MTVLPHPAIRLEGTCSRFEFETDTHQEFHIARRTRSTIYQSKKSDFSMIHSQVPCCQCFSRFRWSKGVASSQYRMVRRFFFFFLANVSVVENQWISSLIALGKPRLAVF